MVCPIPYSDHKNRHLGTIAQLCQAISSQLRHVSTIGKNLLSSNISCTCPHYMVNLSLLATETVSSVWGTPANFNGFHVLASLLQWRHSTETKRTLHNAWPLPGLVDYIYISGSCFSVTEFCQVQYSLCVLEVLHSPTGSVTARQSSSGREPNFAELSTGCHLYLAGRPSRWALAHTLVFLSCIMLGTIEETFRTAGAGFIGNL